MGENIKDGINNYLAPILIVVVGFFLIQSLNQIKDDIRDLKRNEQERNDWVRDWIEEWQPTLEYSRRKMNQGK